MPNLDQLRRGRYNKYLSCGIYSQLIFLSLFPISLFAHVLAPRRYHPLITSSDLAPMTWIRTVYVYATALANLRISRLGLNASEG